MDEVTKLLESGSLELYVLGETTREEAEYIEKMAGLYSIIKEELSQIEDSLEKLARVQAVAPDPRLKPFLMAQINYMDRLEKGELPSIPPVLGEHSNIADYAAWLSREDLEPADKDEDVTARIISATPTSTLAVVWLKYGSPAETHTNEHESFLIVEGSCNIQVDGVDNHLFPGDFFTIPLYASHTVIVTSSCTCKLILQRAAA